MRRLRDLAPWFVAALLLTALPAIFPSGFARSLLCEMGIAIVFALSYNLLLGQSGMLSFGHAVYFGLGGYLAIHVLKWVKIGLPLPVALLPLVGGVGGLAAAFAFGALATRRAGTAFAMITLGLVEMTVALALMFDGMFGGEEGVSANRTVGPRLFGIGFGPQIQVYYLIAFWLFVSTLALYGFTRTPLGRLCNAVRDNPERVAFLGFDPARIRLIAFCLSGWFAGVAGGLFAVNYELLSPVSLGAERSAAVLIMAFVGGVGHFIGPILGAVLVTFLQIAMSDLTQAWLIYLGLFFVLMVLFAPDGLAGLILRHRPLWRAGVLHRMLIPYASALPFIVLLAAAAILLIETNYRLSIRPDLGPVMRLFAVEYRADGLVPWVVAAVLAAVAILGLKRVGPMVAERWQAVSASARATP
jgi:branched-chain amino acid transport system permease protein